MAESSTINLTAPDTASVARKLRDILHAAGPDPDISTDGREIVRIGALTIRVRVDTPALGRLQGGD